MLILLTGCGKTVDNPQSPQVFRLNLPEGLNTLDPATARSRGRIWMTAQIFNGLVALDSALQVVPAIAKMWTISPDGKTYTFTLRDDAYFHAHEALGEDSRTVNAQDFVYSFTRICNPQTASTGFWVFNHKIAGLDAYRDNQADTIKGFRALNDSTFQIELTQPFPAFLSLLAMPYGYVVPREVVEFYGEDFPANPIGTGPFQVFKWEESNYLVLHKNPRYFEQAQGTPLPYLDAVVVTFIPSRLSAFIEFVQGNLDFIGDLDNSYKDEVLNPDGSVKPEMKTQYQVTLNPQLNTEYLGFQTNPSFYEDKNHPLLNPQVRKALNYAIDRAQIVKFLLNGMGYPANSGFVPNGMAGFDPEKVPGFAYRPDSARSLLAAAGYPNGENFPPLTLMATPNYATIMGFVQKSLENMGLQVKIQNMQSGALRKEIYGGRAQFWRASWIADYPDGENYLSLFYTANQAPAGPNTTHFSSQAFDALYVKALTVTDDSTRQAIYQAMDRLMLSEAPIIPLYYDRSFRMLQNEWTGLASNPMNYLYLKRVRRK